MSGIEPIAFVIATKDRPHDLKRTLESLSRQKAAIDQIVVVDGGEVSVEDIAGSFPSLNIRYLVCKPPSAVLQRKAGIGALGLRASLIGFLDDDIVIEPSAVSNMLEFWRDAPADVGGAAFNMMNQPAPFAGGFKKLPVTEALGLYSSRGGRVLASGFHSMIGPVEKDVFVQWLPTGAVLFRRKALEEEPLDEWFKGYSYLEDLDLSYRIGKRYRLAVVAGARYNHFPGASGRGSPVAFGKREILNRLYFVKKHKELSLPRCYLGLHVRIFINLAQGIHEGRWDLMKRAWGNIVGLAISYLSPLRNR